MTGEGNTDGETVDIAEGVAVGEAEPVAIFSNKPIDLPGIT